MGAFDRGVKIEFVPQSHLKDDGIWYAAINQIEEIFHWGTLFEFHCEELNFMDLICLEICRAWSDFVRPCDSLHKFGKETLLLRSCKVVERVLGDHSFDFGGWW